MMKPLILALVTVGVTLSADSFAQTWSSTKNQADDIIYAGQDRTFYCGCEYRSHEDGDGSGDITSTAECGYEGPDIHSSRAARVEWEHIVPASLMPARQFSCWTQHDRAFCEETDPAAQAMLFDLHNLAPSIGQVNALRLNDRYTDLPDDTSDFGACLIEDRSGAFEPPPCLRGDVARTWLYMRAAHDVEIPDDELTMFEAWSEGDPVSPWESEREARVFALTGWANPFVRGVEPDPAGACDWEQM